MAKKPKRPLTPARQVDRLVRGKNRVYARWRKGKTWPQLDNWCTECMMRFGELPEWLEYIKFRRAGSFIAAHQIENELHRPWRRRVKKWALERGVIDKEFYGASFLRYYFAWYRWQYEKRHGKIERNYGRQMS